MANQIPNTGVRRWLQEPTDVIAPQHQDNEMAVTAKAVNDVLLEGSCTVVKQGLKKAGTTAGIPAIVLEPAVDSCVDKAKPVAQESSHKIIDSQPCYGNPNSCVSKTTSTFSWLVSWLFPSNH